MPLFLPHSLGWIDIDSCSKLIPQGKGCVNIGMLKNTHIKVYFLHSVGDIGPYGPVINRSLLLFSCCKTFYCMILPPLPVFLRPMSLCQLIPLRLVSQGHTVQAVFPGKFRHVQVPLEHCGPIRGVHLKVHLYEGPKTNGKRQRRFKKRIVRCVCKYEWKGDSEHNGECEVHNALWISLPAIPLCLAFLPFLLLQVSGSHVLGRLKYKNKVFQ